MFLTNTYKSSKLVSSFHCICEKNFCSSCKDTNTNKKYAQNKPKCLTNIEQKLKIRKRQLYLAN